MLVYTKWISLSINQIWLPSNETAVDIDCFLLHTLFGVVVTGSDSEDGRKLG
jgi:hypothetical protein